MSLRASNFAVIHVLGGIGRGTGLDPQAAGFVDVAYGDDLGRGQVLDDSQQVRATPAGADAADADAVIGAQYAVVGSGGGNRRSDKAAAAVG